MTTLIAIKKSTRKDKKYMAIFGPDGKKVHFGAKGYEDYTIHHDDKRKKSYLSRHKARENWNDPTTAGSLSRYVLWNKKSFRASVADYKKRFKL
jgi:hypothetical protein